MTLEQLVYFHDAGFDLYDFGEGHPFSPLRQRLTFDLLREAGLLPEAVVRAAPPAAEEELLLFHTPEYVDAVRRADRLAAPERWGLGPPDNPVFPHMHRAASLRVGATVAAVREVMSGRKLQAVNFGGGLHHAHPARASGFCIYNDIAVAIRWLRREYGCKVAYVDLDVHHGDGVQWAFYDDPAVLTISIHESGRSLFPGTGDVDEVGEGDARGTSVNVPLLPYTSGSSWFECFEIVVPELLRAFKPDILITQHGCDPHRLDPLAHLAVSTSYMAAAARALRELAGEVCGGRWVALGGGGYSIWDAVPRTWAAVWAEISQQRLPETLPPSWRARWQPAAPVELPVHWDDLVDEPPPKDGADGEDHWRSQRNRRTAQEAVEMALRFLALRRP